MKKNLVVLSGAGMSAESGIKTFRDTDGLWENYAIEEVCTYDAWLKNPSLVLDFYNQRRSELDRVEPNRAHQLVAKLEDHYSVTVITQNIDNLHERAGSTNVVHLHGELTKARSTADPKLVYEIGTKPIQIGDLCEKKSQLRPHIVWFSEAVPMIETAASIVEQADILLIIGTSLIVYPAAGLMMCRPPHCKTWYIDPNPDFNKVPNDIKVVAKTASKGLLEIVSELV